MTESPTGAQHEIVHGEHRAVVTELGAGLRTYEVGGRAVVDGYGADETPASGRGQVLVPWPNRVDGGRYTFAGTEHQLPITEVGKGNASHGLLRWVAWQVQTADDGASTTSRYVLRPQPGYPFTVEVTLVHALDDDGLTVTATLRNVGTGPAPVGMGFHPYVAIGAPHVDDVELTLPAGRYSDVDERGIPGAAHDVVGSAFDFTSPRPVGDTVLDTPFTDLRRDDDGRWRVRVGRPDGSAVTVWGDETYGHLQVFTADAWSGGAPRSAIAVEPMTCPPNAFVTGEGRVVLEPGAALTGSWGLTPS
ncbi:aldose 1-epimerase family protein [Solicola sp. PLA-1-18]|uniref:aldose 1-epimerase family protein n=1 Tax=Solicola sp. PLA-1-18 TaxID=3380532 RepID=UPI003B788AE5